MIEATRSLQNAGKEQEELGWEYTDGHVDCPVCGEAAMLVSTRTRPQIGYLDPDNGLLHLDDGAAYYHADE